MARILFCCLLATFTAVTLCAKSNAEPKKEETGAPASRMDQSMKEQDSMESKDDFDLMGTLMACNETFRIEMSYLESLNESGSFPDETDRTPKCYLRCVLETLEVASMEGEYNPERAAMIFAGMRTDAPMDGIEEIATMCSEQSKIAFPEQTETNKCDRAYNFMKCLFSMEIERYEKKTEN